MKSHTTSRGFSTRTWGEIPLGEIPLGDWRELGLRSSSQIGNLFRDRPSEPRAVNVADCSDHRSRDRRIIDWFFVGFQHDRPKVFSPQILGPATSVIIDMLSTPSAADVLSIPNNVPGQRLPKIAGGKVLFVEDDETNGSVVT